MHLPWLNAFAVALRQWPREYLQFTLAFFPYFRFFSPLGKWSWFTGLILSYHTYFFGPESAQNEWVNHLTYFHPISRVECVHFLTNGMSFCRSLWSRINPGIKTDFPGSNLPSSIDFFTLMESVLPNLTWQRFCTMVWEHLGNSQKELLLSFLSSSRNKGGGTKDRDHPNIIESVTNGESVWKCHF